MSSFQGITGARDPADRHLSYLANLPAELLIEISTHLPVPSLSCFMKTQKRIHACLAGELFRKAVREDENIYKEPRNLAYTALLDNLKAFEGILNIANPEKLKDFNLRGKTFHDEEAALIFDSEGDDDEGDKLVSTTMLHLAAAFFKPPYLHRLLLKLGDANLLDKRELSRGRTPMQQAAKYGRLDNVKILVDFGANVDHKIDEVGEVPGWTPLLRAMANKDLEMVKYLIEAGANPNASMGRDGNNLLTLGLKWTEGFEWVFKKCRFDERVMQLALRRAVREMPDFYIPVKLLVQAGVRPSYELLSIACRRMLHIPCVESIKLLAKHTKAVDRDNHGLTALHMVFDPTIASTVARMVPGIVSARAGLDNFTPLEFLYNNHWRFLQWTEQSDPSLRLRRARVAVALMQNGAPIDFVSGEYKRNVLFSACEMGHEGAVEEIVRRSPVLLGSRDTLGNTPLHMAASSWVKGTDECMKVLLQAGCDVNARNKEGQTPLHCIFRPIAIPNVPPRLSVEAHFTGQKALLLVDYGANMFLRYTPKYGSVARTALAEAISYGYIEPALILIDEVVDILKRTKASYKSKEDVDEIQGCLTEALHTAVENGHMEVYCRLMRADTGCSQWDLSPAGDNILHGLARGAISMAGHRWLSKAVGWRILGYQMPEGWRFQFRDTAYHEDGRPGRYYYHLADEICRQSDLSKLAFAKNRAGYSPLDLYKQAYPETNWNRVLWDIRTSQRKGEDLYMPPPTTEDDFDSSILM